MTNTRIQLLILAQVTHLSYLYSFYLACNATNCNPANTSSTVLANSIGRAATTAALGVTSAMSASNPSAITGAQLMKILEYLRYVNVTHSAELETLYSSFNPSPGAFSFDSMQMTPQMKSAFDNPPTPPVFRRYNISSSFLVSFWDGITSLLIIISSVALISLCNNVVSQMKNYNWLKGVFRFVKITGQNYLLGQFYDSYGDFVMYAILEFRSLTVHSEATLISLLCGILFLILGTALVILHVTLLRKYQKLRNNSNQKTAEKDLEEFEKKHAGVKLLFTDFKDSSYMQQSFVLIIAGRILLYSSFLTLLFDYPLGQMIIFTASSAIIIIYLVLKRPFKSNLDFIQQMCIEILVLFANIISLLLAGYDRSEGFITDQRKIELGHAIIVVNTVATFLLPAFLVPRLILTGMEVWHYFKHGRKQKKVKPAAFESMKLKLTVRSQESTSSVRSELTQTGDNTSRPLNIGDDMTLNFEVKPNEILRTRSEEHNTASIRSVVSRVIEKRKAGMTLTTLQDTTTTRDVSDMISLPSEDLNIRRLNRLSKMNNFIINKDE